MRLRRMLMVGLLVGMPVVTTGCDDDGLTIGLQNIYCTLLPIFTGQNCQLLPIG